MKRRNGFLALAASPLIGAGIGSIVLFWILLIGKLEVSVSPAVGLKAAAFNDESIFGYDVAY